MKVSMNFELQKASNDHTLHTKLCCPAVRLIQEENITLAGGVPSVIMDIIETSIGKTGKVPLENLSCGGAPASETMPGDVIRRFKGAVDVYEQALFV